MEFEKPSSVPGKAMKKRPLKIHARRIRLFRRSRGMIVAFSGTEALGETDRIAVSWPWLAPRFEVRFQLNGAWKQNVVLEMEVLIEIELKLTKPGEKSDMRHARP